VQCFYEGENKLVIDPEESIDSGVCEPQCPAEAIVPDTEDTPDNKWLKVNTDFAKVWPNITLRKDPPADADEWSQVKDKFDKHFSKVPGKGDE
jgi:ferredoxin